MEFVRSGAVQIPPIRYLFFMENQLEGTGKKSQQIGIKRISRRADLLVNWHWLILALAVPFFGLPSPWPIVSILVVTLVWVVLWTSGAKPLDTSDVSGLPMFEAYEEMEGGISLQELAERLKRAVSDLGYYNGLEAGYLVSKGEWFLIPYTLQ